MRLPARKRSAVRPEMLTRTRQGVGSTRTTSSGSHPAAVLGREGSRTRYQTPPPALVWASRTRSVCGPPSYGASALTWPIVRAPVPGPARTALGWMIRAVQARLAVGAEATGRSSFVDAPGAWPAPRPRPPATQAAAPRARAARPRRRTGPDRVVARTEAETSGRGGRRRLAGDRLHRASRRRLRGLVGRVRGVPARRHVLGGGDGRVAVGALGGRGGEAQAQGDRARAARAQGAQLPGDHAVHDRDVLAGLAGGEGEVARDRVAQHHAAGGDGPARVPHRDPVGDHVARVGARWGGLVDAERRG